MNEFLFIEYGKYNEIELAAKFCFYAVFWLLNVAQWWMITLAGSYFEKERNVPQYEYILNVLF